MRAKGGVRVNKRGVERCWKLGEGGNSMLFLMISILSNVIFIPAFLFRVNEPIVSVESGSGKAFPWFTNRV